jgi:tryptophan halogenase
MPAQVNSSGRHFGGAMINKVLILGGGSAGFLAAIALKTKITRLAITLVRSPDIGIIGVGEGSTIALTSFLHSYLKIDRAKFFEVAQPTWKLGLKFLWGPRPYFNYTFGAQLDAKPGPEFSRACGYHCEENIENTDALSALMSQDKVFEIRNGAPVIHDGLAYHFENEKFVHYLESAARTLGVEIMDAKVAEVKRSENGVAGLVLGDGQTLEADLYVDASGFRSELLGRAMNEPYISYKSTLFCDRAVIGGWNRRDSEDQTIRPYTTCETMDSGWAWQIEHENRINRGYVYSSAFISDEDADREFRRKNPKIDQTRIVKFISGRYERTWVRNVVGIGNASGFVEPLEATALGGIAGQCRTLADVLMLSDCLPRRHQINFFNRLDGLNWDSVRNFLAIHYRFNTRLDTEFWRHCRANTNLAGAAEVSEAYQELGPDSYFELIAFGTSFDQFRLGGYITLMTGMKVPYQRTFTPCQQEMSRFELMRSQFRCAAAKAMPVREALAVVRSPTWRWS